MVRLQIVKFAQEIFPKLRYMSQQAVELAQKFDRHRACERAATEGCPVHSRVHAACDAMSSQQCAEGQSSCKWLGYGHDVGRDPVLLIRKILSGATQAALDFIEQQQRCRFLREFAREPQKLRADGINSTLALNRL